MLRGSVGCGVAQKGVAKFTWVRHGSEGVAQKGAA
jgi:hypothetical protein